MKNAWTWVLCTALAGCVAALGGPTTAQQVAFCGTEEAFRQEQQRMKVLVLEQGVTRPQVGWTGCQVIASLGPPNEQTVVETEGSRSAHWTYWTGTGSSRKARLLVMGPGPDGRGVVESVVW